MKTATEKWHPAPVAFVTGAGEGLEARLRRVALVASAVLAAAFGCLTVAYGFIWLVPMALSVALGVTALAWATARNRLVVQSALAQIPARRYTLPLGTAERTVPIAVTCDGDRETSGVSVVPTSAAQRWLERAMWGARGGIRRGVIRLRFPGAPFDGCFPAVYVSGRAPGLAVTLLGPDRALVARLRPDPRLYLAAESESAWDAVLAHMRIADEARARDLEALGALGPVPAQVASAVLTEAGYESAGVLPLVAASDYLTLAELEFAWPPGGEFRTTPFDVTTESPRAGLAGLLAEGALPSAESDVYDCLDLVLVRTSDDTLQAFARRYSEG